MRPFGSPSQLERRRLKAMNLLDSGLSPSQVARKVGCDRSSVTRWRDARDRGGAAALAAKPAAGRPCRMTARQKRRLVELLVQGAVANGYRTELWTTARIAELIDKRFGILYHRDHIGRLMKSLGWSCQKPERRAIEHDDEAIERWKRERWPEVKKTPRGWRPISSSSTNRGSS